MRVVFEEKNSFADQNVIEKNTKYLGLIEFHTSILLFFSHSNEHLMQIMIDC